MASVASRAKFYDMRVKKLKEMQALGIIVVKYCVTANMVADLFTKNVNAVVFERLANVLTGAGETRESLSKTLLSLK